MTAQNPTNAKAPIGLIIILIVVIVIAFKGCLSFDRDLVWSVPLDKDDAFTISSVILGQSKVEGCGDLEVTHVSSLSKEVTVKCGDGREHRLEWHPVFKVDGRTPDHLVWDRPSLEKLYCVKDEAGKWHAAYIDSDKAIAYVEALSTKTGTPARIYRSDSAVYGVTSITTDGKWAAMLNYDRLVDTDERRGCEITDDRT